MTKSREIFKEYFHTLTLIVQSADLLIILASGYAAYFLRFGFVSMSDAYLFVLSSALAIALFLFPFFKLYSSIRSYSLMAYLWRVTQAVAVMGLLLAGLGFMTKSGEGYSRLWFVLWLGSLWFLMVCSRCALVGALRYMRARGLNERRVVIIGVGELGIKLATAVQQALWTGFKVVQYLDDNAKLKPAFVQNIPVVQTPVELGEYLAKEKIDEVWMATPLRDEIRVKEIVHELRHHTICLRYALDIFGLDLLNHSVTDLAGFPLLNIRSTPMIGGNRLIKALEDRVLAALILVLISPLMLMITIAIKLTSRGPVFYRQKRVGWNGQEFEMLKFRSMPVNAEDASGPVWATSNDVRPTKLGKFLRRTSLDELPQFINVLKGDMSIVGPRPERKVFVDEFKEKVPRYMQKHFVKAGITGWAQVNGWRGDTSLNKRIEYDLFYIDHWSLGFDIRIIFLTILRGFVNRNAY